MNQSFLNNTQNLCTTSKDHSYLVLSPKNRCKEKNTNYSAISKEMLSSTNKMHPKNKSLFSNKNLKSQTQVNNELLTTSFTNTPQGFSTYIYSPKSNKNINKCTSHNLSTVFSMLNENRIGFLDVKEAERNIDLDFSRNTLNSKRLNCRINNYLQTKSGSQSPSKVRVMRELNELKTEGAHDQSCYLTNHLNNKLSSPETTLDSVLNGYQVYDSIERQINRLQRDNGRKSQLGIKVEYCAKEVNRVYSSVKNCVNKPVVNLNQPNMNFSYRDYLQFSPTRKPKESFVQCNVLRNISKRKEYLFNDILERHAVKRY